LTRKRKGRRDALKWTKKGRDRDEHAKEEK
jgi:hypothetical protein